MNRVQYYTFLEFLPASETVRFRNNTHVMYIRVLMQMFIQFCVIHSQASISECQYLYDFLLQFETKSCRPAHIHHLKEDTHIHTYIHMTRISLIELYKNSSSSILFMLWQLIGDLLPRKHATPPSYITLFHVSYSLVS